MPSKTSNRYLLLYGSQTGQAKAIAEEIFERSAEQGLQPELHCLSMTDKKFNIEKEHCVVLVTSTTGDGEPPDTALKFVRRMNKKTLPDDYLSSLNYTILGLGDTNYSNFCNNAVNIDRRLSQLGGQRFYSCGFADEAVGLEVVVDPWIEGLFPALQMFLDVSQNSNKSVTTVVTDPATAQPVLNGTVTPQKEASESSQSLTAKSNSDSDRTREDSQNPERTITDVQNPDKTENGSESPETDPQNLRTRNGSETPTEEKSNESQNLMGNSSESVVSESDLSNSRLTEDSGDSNRTSVTVSSSLTNTESNDFSPEGPLAEQTGARDSVDGCETSATDASLRQTDSSTRDTCLLNLNKASTSAPSLGVSDSPLSESGLTLPAVTPVFLSAAYGSPDQDLPKKLAALPWQNDCKPPSAVSDIMKARIVSVQRLTTEDAVKKTLLLRLDIKETGLKYHPGDSISVVCPNDDKEVNQVIARLSLASVADLPLQLSIIPDTKKRRAVIPPHIPEEGASLRYVLKNCVDIREPPKKALLRMLVDYTSEASEKRRLQELCSKQGVEDYAAFVRNENVSLLDVLYTFSSSQPPVERLLEHLPRLQPRAYSASSCQEWLPGHLDIAFNVVEIPASECRLYSRRGVCTGWLDDITQPLQHDGIDNKDEDIAVQLATQTASLSLKNLEIQIFSRTNQNFRQPSDLSVPLIMIGPGTGVAPYIGFLQERQLRIEKEKNGDGVGETWLFFGNRHEKRDFLFRSSLEGFQANGTLTKFLPVFSRDAPSSPDNPKYVQDNIQAFSSEVFDLIHNKQAVVFVCGDAKNMAKDVGAAFEEIVLRENGEGLSAEDAKMYVMKMRIHRRYLEEVWA